MKNLKSHFKFNKQEQSGIFFLILFIVILQGLFFYLKTNVNTIETKNNGINELEQKRIDSLKAIAQLKDSLIIYPFNPNFITDYKGYTLGMSTEEIDKLHAFRKLGDYLNSKKEFQQVTGVSDSLLNVIAPYFKFPAWVKTTKKKYTKHTLYQQNKNLLKIQDINTVIANDLKTINGIGDKLSERIIKFRNRLGGFVVNEQLYDVFGLDRLVADKALQKFQVIKIPTITKININTATEEEIAQLVYLTYRVSKRIVAYRSEKGSIVSFDELTKIEDFPSEKLDRIRLYLSL